MNKLLQKVAKIFLGLSMAAGVGVAVSDNKVISTAHAADTFEKVTSFSVGDQIIFVNESKKYEMSSGAGSNASAYSTSPAGTYVMTVEAGNGGTGYSFKNGSNYISWSTGNNLATSTTKNNASSWTISTSTNGNFKLANVGTTSRILQFNSSSPKFAPYTSSQTAFQIYKKVSAKTLSSISVSGYTTSFTVGDTFSFGGTVTATYSDETTADVTSSATFSGYNMSTAGNYTVTVSYTEGGVTKTATYSITVAAHTHTFSNAWSSDDTHHWHAATCGHDVTDSYAEHTFGAWQEDTAASCTTDGSRHHVCSVCSKSVSETIPATGHNYVNGVCTICGEEEPSEVTITKTMSEIISANNYTVSSGSDVTLYTSFSLDAVITISTSGEANCGSFWGTNPNNDWRLYQNKSGDVTITATSPYELESVTITYNISNTGILKDGTTEVSSGTAVACSGSSKTFTVGNSGSATNGQVKITSISVTYSGSSSSPTLSSIAVKTAPTKTSYLVGDFFEPAGLVITKTLSDNSTEDVSYADESSSFSFTPSTSTALTLSDETVTITYGGKSCSQAISVSSIPIPSSGSITITDSDFTGGYEGGALMERSTTVTGGAVVNWKYQHIMKSAGIQFRKYSDGPAILYNTSDLGNILSVTTTGVDNLTITYGTTQDTGCTSSTVGTGNGFFKIINNTSNAVKPSEIVITWGEPATLSSISVALESSLSEKTWYGNDVISASDVDVTTSYSDSSLDGTIEDGTGIYFDNDTSKTTFTLSQGTNNIEVYYKDSNDRTAHATLTISNVQPAKTVQAWSLEGSIGDTLKSTAYNLSGLTLHAWYDSGKTDEAPSSVAALYQLVADPTTAGSSADPDNVIDVKVQLKSDSSTVYTFEDVAAPIVNSPKGSVDNPYTSSEAVAAVLAYGSTTASTDTYYAYGYVKKISGKNLWIVDDPDLIGAQNEPADADCLQCYASANWSDVALGDKIDVSGKMQVYSSKAEFSSSAITNKIAETMTISKTVSSQTLTINSAFSYSGVVSIDYTHKTDIANANALVTFGGYDMSTTGNQTVTISYTDAALGKTDSTTYTLTVEYAAVTTVTLNHTNITVEPVSETNFSVTLNPNVDPNSTATWDLDNADGSSLDLSLYEIESTNKLTATLTCIGESTDYGVLIVTATVGGVSATCTVTVTGDAYVTFNKDSIHGIVGATLDNTVKVTPVGLGTPTSYTWTVTSGSDVVGATSGSDTSTLTFKAAGTATLHVAVSDGSDTAEGDIAVNVIKSLNPITIPGGTTEYNDSITFSSVCNADDTFDDATITDADEFDVYFNKGTNSNKPVYKTTGSAIRVYGGSYFTVSSEHTMTKIELSYGSSDGSNAITTNVGEFATNTWTGSSTSVTFTIGGTSGHRKIAGVKIYWEVSSADVPVANTNYNAQKAVLEFAEDLTTKLNAVCLQGEGGTTVVANLNTAWTNIHNTYTSKRNSLGSSDQEVFDILIANATANEAGDDLQKALRSYEWVYAKYHDSLTAGDFLNETSGRGAVSYSPLVNPLVNIIGENTNTVAIIVIISMVSVTAIGGYFFLRKRKENI